MQAERRGMLLSLLILGVAGYASLVTAMKQTPKASKIHAYVSAKAHYPKIMGMLALGMQTGELVNHQEKLSVVPLFAVVFSAAIWGAMKMRSGVEHKLL